VLISVYLASEIKKTGVFMGGAIVKPKLLPSGRLAEIAKSIHTKDLKRRKSLLIILLV